MRAAQEVKESPFIAKGDLGGLFRLFLPLLGTSFSNYLFLLVEKIFLTRYSPVAMEAAINTAYACQIFQGTCITVAMMAQVFIGRWHGARSWADIGPGTWQFIWFSFLSMLITVPAGLVYGEWYFQGTEIRAVALPYFYLLVGFNFLYPLSAVLSCFYLGQGKTKLVLLASLGAQSMKIGLAYLLIFGWGKWISPFGIMGGAMSTVITQFAFCLLLFCVFLNKRHRTVFCSSDYRFRLRLFWECVCPCFLRAMNRILSFTSWASIAHLIVAKGGDYLLIFSIGGSLNLFLPFLFEAICEAQTTVTSHLIGAKRGMFLSRAIRSGFLLVLCMVSLMSIPFLVFPSFTFHALFPGVSLDPFTLQKVFFGIWLSFAFFTLCSIPISFVIACKDMKFSLLMGCISWINGYLLIYFFVVQVNIAAENFWFALALMHGTTALLYIWRMRILSSRHKALDLFVSKG